MNKNILTTHVVKTLTPYDKYSNFIFSQSIWRGMWMLASVHRQESTQLPAETIKFEATCSRIKSILNTNELE